MKKINKYDKTRQQESKLYHKNLNTVPQYDTLLDRLKAEVKDFKDLMDSFHGDCGVKYSPRTIQQLFQEIKHYTDPVKGYGQKWTQKDYKGAIKDIRYAIACLEFLPEIASPETIQFLIPELKSGEEYQLYEVIQKYIDDQVEELENVIDQIHLDWDSENKNKKGPS